MIQWIKNIFRPQAASVQRGIELEELLSEWSAVSVSGRHLGESAALKASVVFACVRLISGAVASSPCLIYKGTRFQQDREPAPAHHLSPLLVGRPNEMTTAYTFWKSLATDKLLHGNAYAPLVRNQGETVTGIYRAQPKDVSPYYAYELGYNKLFGVPWNRLFYVVRFADGTERTYDQSDMLHVPNMNWNGKAGVSTIQAASEALAGALDAQEHVSRFFGQGAMFNYALSYPGKVGPEKAKEIREYFKKKMGGVSRHYLPPVLSEGGDLKAFSFNPKESQLVESREFSVVDICRYFGVPPVMVGETTKTTSWGSGVEQMARWFAKFTLNDHFNAFEQELDRKLFKGRGYFAAFDETELIRGDTKTQYDAFKIARGNTQEPGILTINEIRQALGYGPTAGGDELFKPVENGGNPNEGQA